MKIRSGFVSNSSSSSFIITNKTREKLHITDFLNENKDHFEKVVDEWNIFEIDYDQFYSSFEDEEFFGLESGDNELEFSDDDMCGFEEKVDCIMHHALEDELESERFKSKVKQWHMY